MKKQFTILSILIVAVFGCFALTGQVNAETEVGGNISINTTWTLDNSPYIVTGTVQVLGDVKLTIEPGVEVKFNENTGLNIGGELNAVGTESEMIIFTSNQDAPQSQDWIGIKFTDDSVDAQVDSQNNYLSGSIIKYCVIEYGGGFSNGIYFVGAIELNRASPYVSNNVIRHNFSYDAGGGMFVYIASPVITYNTFSDNIANNQGGAIFFERSSSVTSHNTIINNTVTGISGRGGGIHVQGQYSQDIVKITFNLIKNNTATNGNAVSLNPYNTSSLIPQADINYNNIVNNNSGYEIYTFNNADIDVTNNYWGTADSTEIDEKIYDYYDDISLGKVNYEPYALVELKFDGVDIFSQSQLCTSWTYSDWSSCSSNSQQTRSIVSSSPTGCVGGNPVLSQFCTYTSPNCTSWAYSDWSSCSNNSQQTRSVVSYYPNGCSGGNPILTQSCIYVSPTCISWVYSDWDDCINGQQTRNIISSSPENCIDGNPILSQTCQIEIEVNNTDVVNNSDQITENNNIENSSNQNNSNDQNNSNSQTVIQEEKKLITKIDKNLSKRVSGNILLQVEKNGEGWYVYPNDQKKYYLGRPADAFSIMRNLGLGIKHSELNNYLNSTFPSRLSGKIMLDVEQNGEAYYINPNDLKGHYLNRPSDAFRIMRELGLGITNSDVRKIDVGGNRIKSQTQP